MSLWLGRRTKPVDILPEGVTGIEPYSAILKVISLFLNSSNNLCLYGILHIARYFQASDSHNNHYEVGRAKDTFPN